VTTRSITFAALLAVLGRPSWWLLALAGFLVRGGVVLFALAIVSLPSPLVISNVVAPVVVPIALGRIDTGTIALIGLGLAFVATWLVGGGWIAAATEIALVRDARDAMADEWFPVRPAAARPGRWLMSRVALARLIAHVPTALVVGVASVRIGSVAYAELTNPFEVTTPLVVRVMAGAAAPIGAILAVWLLGEIVGGLAARHLILRRASLFGALGEGIGECLRHPVATLLPAVLVALVLAIDLVVLLSAIGVVWTQVADALLGGTIDGTTLAIALTAFGGTWIGALALTGLIDAWRSVSMTFEAERMAVAAPQTSGDAPDPAGTIGASPSRRPGDWSTGDRGGSL
jgi:hypothetical protein